MAADLVHSAIAEALAEEAEKVAADWQDWVTKRAEAKRSSMPVYLEDVAIILTHRALLIAQVAALSQAQSQVDEQSPDTRVAALLEPLLPLDFEPHESETIKRSAREDRSTLARRMAAVLVEAGVGFVARAKAEALREAAEELGRLWVKEGKHFADGIYSPGYERWLRARADREATG